MNAQHVATATETDLPLEDTPGLGRPLGEVVCRTLRSSDLPAIKAHLLALGRGDRASRFHALLGDDAIHAYIGRIDFSRMILIGAFDGATEQLVGWPRPISTPPSRRSGPKFRSPCWRATAAGASADC
jgi:hypothetical protein